MWARSSRFSGLRTPSWPIIPELRPRPPPRGPRTPATQKLLFFTVCHTDEAPDVFAEGALEVLRAKFCNLNSYRFSQIKMSSWRKKEVVVARESKHVT